MNNIFKEFFTNVMARDVSFVIFEKIDEFYRLQQKLNDKYPFFNWRVELVDDKVVIMINNEQVYEIKC